MGETPKPGAPRRRLVRVVAGALGLGLGFTALVGFAHTKPGRPLLAWMGMGSSRAGACPFGYDVPATPEQREASLRKFAASHPATERAASRPALGFELGRATRADVEAWAAKFSVACKKPKSGPDLDCSDVPDDALPDSVRGGAVKSVWLSFDAQDKLASLTVVRKAASADEVAASFNGITSELGRSAGPSSNVHGEPSAAYLAKGPLYQVSAEYQYRGYYAVIRATNMRDSFALTEDYKLLPD